MTARTLVAAGGNWSNAASWSPAGVPAAGDVLTLASTSGALTVDGTSGSPNLCRGMTISSYSGYITAGSTAYIKVGDSTAGAFNLSTSGGYSNSGLTVEFVSTTTGNTFTWSPFVSTVIFSGVGGGWTATNDMTNITYSAVITHTAGALVLTSGNQTGFGYSGTGTTTRSLTYAGGANTWTVDAWDITDSTNMTLSVSSITFGGTVFNGGGLTYGALIQAVDFSGPITINQANTFSSVTLSGYGGANNGYIFGANQTCTGTWTGNGDSASARAYYSSAVKGSPVTLSAATFSFSYIDLEDITKGGAGSGNISAITGGSGDCTGNSGWVFTSPQNNYWVPAGGTSTGNENAVTNWASSSGGTAGTGRIPLPQDTCIFDANSIDAASRTITCGLYRIGTHNWTGVTNSPTWDVSGNFYGSLIMVSGMTFYSGGLIYAGELSSNFDTGGVADPALDMGLSMDCGNGTLIIPVGATSTVVALEMISGTILVLGTFQGGETYSNVPGGAGTIQIGENGTFQTTVPSLYPGPIIEVSPGLTNAVRTIGFSSVALATGQQGAYVVFPVNGTITGWSIVADSGTATVETWKIAAGTTSPTSANSISTSGVSLSTGSAIISSTMTDFTTTTVMANDIFAFNLSAFSGATKVEFQLQITVS